MSRSVRNRHDKNGVYLKWCGKSDKKDKRIANRKFRRQEHIEEKATLIEGEDKFKTTDIKDISNNWDFSSDGGAGYMLFNKTTRWRDPIKQEEQYRYRNK